MWTFTIPGQPPVSPADLNSGEVALAYAIASSLVAHTEDEIGPSHCPLCRNAIAIVALMRVPFGDDGDRLDLDTASALVRLTPPHELRAMIGNTLTDEKPTPPAANRQQRRARPAKKVAKKAVKKPAKRT